MMELVLNLVTHVRKLDGVLKAMLLLDSCGVLEEQPTDRSSLTPSPCVIKYFR